MRTFHYRETIKLLSKSTKETTKLLNIEHCISCVTKLHVKYVMFVYFKKKLIKTSCALHLINIFRWCTMEHASLGKHTQQSSVIIFGPVKLNIYAGTLSNTPLAPSQHSLQLNLINSDWKPHFPDRFQEKKYFVLFSVLYDNFIPMHFDLLPFNGFFLGCDYQNSAILLQKQTFHWDSWASKISNKGIVKNWLMIEKSERNKSINHNKDFPEMILLNLCLVCLCFSLFMFSSIKIIFCLTTLNFVVISFQLNIHHTSASYRY